MPRPLIPLLAAAAALTLAACTDTEEKNDYVDEVDSITTTLGSGLTEVSTEATAISSPAQAAEVFSGFESASSEISEVSAPEEVAELHDRLVEQVRSLAAEAKNAADEIKAGGPAAVAGVASGFIGEATSLSAEVDATITEINSELQE